MYKVIAKKGKEWHNIYNDTWLVTAENNKTAVATDMILTMEDNQAGSFTITIAPENNGYDFIERYSTEIIVYRIDRRTTSNVEALVETEIFRGRVVNESENFLRHRILTCEGELNYLCDTRQPHKRYSRLAAPTAYFKALLNIHNSKAEKKKQFKMGVCEFASWSENVINQIDPEDEDNDDVLYRDTQYEDTLTCISNAFEDLDNPHLRVRWNNGVRYLDFLKDSRDGGTFGATLISNQEVTLEKNLLDYTKNYDLANICSVIVPLGAQIEGDKIHLGTPVPFTYWDVYYAFGTAGSVLDPTTHLPAGIDDENFQVSEAITVQAGRKYFYTGRQWNGYGMYTFVDANHNVLEYKKSTESDSENGRATDLIEYVIQAPEGAKFLYIAGYGEEIPLRLNFYIDDENQLEQYVTVTDIVDNTAGRKKKKGTNYVTSKDLLKKYGWIERVVEFPNVKTPQVLYNRAVKYLEEDIYENLLFEVKAVDMNLLDSSITPYSIGKSVHVYSNRHNLDKNFPITKMEIHLDDPGNSTITLGYQTKLNISGITTKNSAQIYKKVEAVRLSESDALKQAVDNATYLIKNGMNGYVTLVRDPNDNEVIREIVISDNPDYTKATKVWRWNNGGLGYSKTGYNDATFRANLALTSDGAIVADRITTGHLSADRIKGGTLYVGGSTDASGNPIHGRIYVLDEGYREGDVYKGHIHYKLGPKGLEIGEPYPSENRSLTVGRVGSYDEDGGGDSMDLYIQTFRPSSTSGYGNIFVISNADITLMPKSGHLYVGKSWNERYQGLSATVNLTHTRLIFKHGLLVGSEPIG